MLVQYCFPLDFLLVVDLVEGSDDHGNAYQRMLRPDSGQVAWEMSLAADL